MKNTYKISYGKHFSSDDKTEYKLGKVKSFMNAAKGAIDGRR